MKQTPVFNNRVGLNSFLIEAGECSSGRNTVEAVTVRKR